MSAHDHWSSVSVMGESLRLRLSVNVRFLCLGSLTAAASKEVGAAMLTSPAPSVSPAPDNDLRQINHAPRLEWIDEAHVNEFRHDRQTSNLRRRDGGGFESIGSHFPELWLDLTETALSPSGPEVQTFHSSLLASIETDEERKLLGNAWVWDKVVIEDGDGRVVLSDCSPLRVPDRHISHPSSMVGGSAFQLVDTIDPIEALESILSRKWVMIESSTDIISNDPHSDRLKWLLDFLSSVLCTRSGASSGSSASDFQPMGIRVQPVGGVSVRCKGTSGLVSVFRFLTENHAYYRSTATESGLLLIPNRITETDPSDAENLIFPGFSASIALPLDSHLWETALAFRGKQR